MKCLTIREPWATAVMDGLKPVENRTRNIAGTHRGAIAVHVSGTYDGHPATEHGWPGDDGDAQARQLPVDAEFGAAVHLLERIDAPRPPHRE